MQKPFFLMICCLLVVAAAQSQEVARSVIASGGAAELSGPIAVSWSLGQPVHQTLESAATTITQGYQQPEILLVGTSEIPQELDLSIYPNPSHQFLFIDWTASGGAEVAEVAVLGVDGKALFRQQLVEGQNQIATHQLPAGTYVLAFYQAGQQVGSSIFQIIH